MKMYKNDFIIILNLIFQNEAMQLYRNAEDFTGLLRKTKAIHINHELLNYEKFYTV
jgi:hypothetical protein